MHTIKHTHRGALWCGLAALSALTGNDTETCKRAVKRYRGRPVRGIATGELALAARDLGYVLRRVHIAGSRPTMNQWRRANQTLVNGEHPVVLVVSNHYVVLHGRKFADSQEGNIWYGDTKRKRCRVSHYFVVEGRCDGRKPEPAPPRPKDTDRKARTEAKALAARYGIEIDVYNEARVHGEIECWVYPPDDLDGERDAFENDHLAFGWSDVLERCKKYAADMEAILNPPQPQPDRLA